MRLRSDLSVTSGRAPLSFWFLPGNEQQGFSSTGSEADAWSHGPTGERLKMVRSDNYCACVVFCLSDRSEMERGRDLSQGFP